MARWRITLLILYSSTALLTHTDGGVAMAHDTKISVEASALAGAARAPQPQGWAYLGNNPRCKLIPWRHVDTGITEEMESVPSLVADFTHLPRDGEWRIGATVLDGAKRKLFSVESSVSSSKGGMHHIWRLDAPLVDPCTVQLTAAQGSYVFEETSAVRLYRLSGKVTYFDGRPAKATVHANGLEGVAALTDAAERYTLWLPGIRIRALQAYDDGIGRTTVETWIYDYTPQDDLELDIRVGELELYELHAWRGYLGVKADFVPMSISHVLRCLERQPKGKGPYAPSFSADDIAVVADGHPASVVSVVVSVDKRKQPFFGRDLPEGFDLPDPQDEYSLQVAVPDCSPGSERGSTQIIKVVLKSGCKDGGSQTTEQGEAFYLGLRNGSGVNAGYEY